MTPVEARKFFPGAKDKTFLDSACVGLAPQTAQDAITRFLDLVVFCPASDISEHHVAMDEMKNTAVVEAATLMNANVDDIALIESTTHGLNIAANSIPFSPDDEIMICDNEYLQIAIPFMKREAAKKLKVVRVNSSQLGCYQLADFEEKITKKTKAICLSSVQWCTGQRVFSSDLGEICRSLGIWLIVDGVQELGALVSDPSLRYCDFYIAGGHKWLNAPFGCGLMYMSKRAQELEPPSYGYLNLPTPKSGWGKFFQEPTQSPFRQYEFPHNAKSFGIGGTGNYPGAIGLAESMKIVNMIGRENAQRRILELTCLLREELSKLGAKIISPGNPEQLSGITIFRLFDSYDDDVKALEYLQAHRIFLSIRYTNGHGGLRVSLHYYNNEEDIISLCSAIATMKRLA